jgi:hypothetical protein
MLQRSLAFRTGSQQAVMVQAEARIEALRRRIQAKV